MKKIIIGILLSTLLSSSLYAEGYIDDLGNYVSTKSVPDHDYDDWKEVEEKRRDSLSPEERKVEDLEKENRLKQRQRDAQREKERLEAEERAEKEKEAEKDTTWGKVKSFF